MPLSLASRADLTLANFRRVAWQGEAARFAPAALARMTASRRQFLDLLESDPELTIYGVTSGYGQHANKRLSSEERRRQARRPPHGPAVAFGPPLPERVVRGIVFARLANYVEGHAAASAELAAAVASMLEGERPRSAWLQAVPARSPPWHRSSILPSGWSSARRRCSP